MSDQTPASESDLKGCPFCGRQPQLTSRGACDSERSPNGQIHFLACHCGDYSAHAHQFGYTLEEVRAAWNARVSESAPAPSFDEALRKATQAIIRSHGLEDTSTQDWFAGPCYKKFEDDARDALEGAGIAALFARIEYLEGSVKRIGLLFDTPEPQRQQLIDSYVGHWEQVRKDAEDAQAELARVRAHHDETFLTLNEALNTMHDADKINQQTIAGLAKDVQEAREMARQWQQAVISNWPLTESFDPVDPPGMIAKLIFHEQQKAETSFYAQQQTIQVRNTDLAEAHERIEQLEAQATEWDTLFALQSQASRRAIKMWQEKHPGREDTWPDKADLELWLMERLDEAQTERDRLRDKYGESAIVNEELRASSQKEIDRAVAQRDETRSVLAGVMELANSYAKESGLTWTLTHNQEWCDAENLLASKTALEQST